MLALAFGTLMHLILDQMWRAPTTLIWPAYGWAFPKENTTNWIPQVLHGVVADPSVLCPGNYRNSYLGSVYCQAAAKKNVD